MKDFDFVRQILLGIEQWPLLVLNRAVMTYCLEMMHSWYWGHHGQDTWKLDTFQAQAVFQRVLMARVLEMEPKHFTKLPSNKVQIVS